MIFDTLPQPSGSFRWVQVDAGFALVCTPLEPFANHLFTTRAWLLGATPPFQPQPPPPREVSSAVTDGWDDVAGAMGVAPHDLVRVHQVHGRAVFLHRKGDRAPVAPPDADIIITADSGVALAVQTADCVALLMADPCTGAVAAVHAGWRGLAAGAPIAAVESLACEFGSRPSNLIAAVGPAIGACCYEVGADVRERFGATGFPQALIDRWFRPQPGATPRNPPMEQPCRAPRAGRWFFDGWRATVDELETAGVPPERVHLAELCTSSHFDAFCSYRRDGKGAGRTAAAIRCLPPRP